MEIELELELLEGWKETETPFGLTHPVQMWRSVAWACIPAIPPLPVSTPQPPTSVIVREASQEMECTTATRRETFCYTVARVDVFLYYSSGIIIVHPCNI